APIIIIIIILALSTPAFSQDRSGEILQQLEKKEIVPKPSPETPVIEKKEEKPPKAVDGKKILIRQIKLQGAALIEEQTLKTILSKYENKELTLSEMNQIAEDITANYRKQGYILAYAYIPPQEIKDGILEISVIEGKTGEITVRGNKSYSAKFIQRHLERIKQDPSLKEETIERALLILNEYPSLNVKASLTAGKDLGATDIAAQAKDSLPISGNLSYDNFGTNITSKHRLGAAFNIGNLITSGDYLMLRGLTGLDRIDLNKLSYGRAEYLFPIDYNGTKMGLNYANSVYKAGEQYTILDIHGKAHVAGIYLTHPIIKTRKNTLDIKLGFDYKDVYDYLLDSIRSKDNIRVFNLGATSDSIDNLYGRNIITLTYHQGVRNLLGGNGKKDPDASRLNADGAFAKYTADIIRLQKLPGYNHLMLRGSGQLSEDNLFVAEQFMLGGAGSVRGFRPSSQSGDSGYFGSAELHLSPIYPETKILNQNIGDTIKLALFADHGGVYRNNAQPGENKNDYLTSIGAGLRLYAGKYFSVRYDYALPEINGNFSSHNSEHYLQATVAF
ncbi:MAG: ShlB/FhaC/HecB family hemolysin secretion/activation protein, partial [Nitrospirae bacterium]